MGHGVHGRGSLAAEVGVYDSTAESWILQWGVAADGTGWEVPRAQGGGRGWNPPRDRDACCCSRRSDCIAPAW
jgi:hypothetical protein